MEKSMSRKSETNEPKSGGNITIHPIDKHAPPLTEEEENRKRLRDDEKSTPRNGTVWASYRGH